MSDTPQTPVSDRYYEGLCEPFDGEPLRSKFGIVRNDTVGEGLFAKQDFDEGKRVFVFFGDKTDEISLYTLQHPDGYHVHDPIVMGKVLHSCEPNMVCDMTTLTYTACKPIKNGDLLTMDYCTTETQLFQPFTCHCNNPSCKGFISGRV